MANEKSDEKKSKQVVDGSVPSPKDEGRNVSTEGSGSDAFVPEMGSGVGIVSVTGSAETIISEPETPSVTVKEEKTETITVEPGAVAVEVAEPVVINRVTNDSWQCPKCGKTHQYRSFLVKHIKHKHRDIAEQLLPLVPGEVGTRPLASTPQAPLPKPDFSDLNGSASPVAGATEAVQVASIDYKALSEMMFDTSTALMAGSFGPEWKPRNADERSAVVGPLARYLESKQVRDVPPGMMLCIVVVAYSAPRLKEPSTAGKLKLAYGWVKSKLSRGKK